MRKKCCIFLLGVFFTTVLCAQERALSNDTIPLSSKVRRGVLKNGLTYYILPEQSTNKAIMLRLIQKVGKYHEGRNEIGAAHLVEHLAFRSTKNFPDGIKSAMARLGVSWGNVIGQTTSIITRYGFRIPGGDSLLLRNSLNVLHDFAKGRLYEPREVEEERAAVLNEYGQGVPGLTQSTWLMIDKDPRHDGGARLNEAIQNSKIISSESLKQFDQKWYRPDMQCLIVAGDVAPMKIEGMIQEMFSDLKTPRDVQRPRWDTSSDYKIQLTGKNKLIIVEDPSVVSGIRIQIFHKRTSAKGVATPATLSQLQIALTSDLYNEMVKQRFGKIDFSNRTWLKSLESSIIREMGFEWMGIDALATRIDIENAKDISQAISLISREMHRIEKWGFTETELVDGKVSLLKSYQHRGNSLIEFPLTNHFLFGSAFPDDFIQLKEKILGNISVNDVNAMAGDWIREEGNTDVVISVKEGIIGIPGEKQVFAWIGDGMHANVRPFKESLRIVKALPAPPVNSDQSFTRTELNDIKATELLFSNGVKVIIKRLGTENQNPWHEQGDIFLTGFREGGTNVYGDQDYASAKMASSLMSASGIAALNDSEFKEWLNEKRKNGELSVFPQISDSQTTISGTATRKNSDDLFHLVYLYFVQPRKDKAVFEKKIKLNREKMGRVKTPEEVFEDSIQAVAYGNLQRRMEGEATFSKTWEICRERFSNAGDLTFVISGFFELDSMIAKASKYLGSLPVTRPNARNSENVPNRRVPLQENEAHIVMTGDSTGLAEVRMIFKGKVDHTVRNRLITNLVGPILTDVLHQRLREKEKGVYWVMPGAAFSGHDRDLVVEVKFPTSPENVDRLSLAVVEELQGVAKGNIDDTTFNNAVTTVRSGIVNDLKNGNYVNEYIIEQLRNGAISADGFKRQEILNEITKQDVINLVRDSLDKDHYLLFELL
jgi:zinc protease